jgi:N-acetylmuramoyl-L-alanine amidase
MPTRKELGAELNLEEDLIPVLNSNRPGRLMTPDKITIHETDNESDGAGAIAHAYYMKGEDARKRQVSWHYTVDDKMCIKSVPINEIAWHAASAEGNSRSIGIEICVNGDSNKKNADERAAKLVAVLMYDLGISIENVVTHNYWSGKNCPRNLLDNGRPGAKWQKFLDNVTKKLDSITPIAPPGASDPFSGIGGDTSGHEDEIPIPPPGGATQPGGVNLNVPYLSQADNWIAPLATCGYFS